jgi:antitoxin (DNA-binding transcriptional repressor) of toxin-antitoxin stability system
MPRIGIGEPGSCTSQVLRAVRDEKAEYIVTCRGRPVPKLAAMEEQEDEDIWAELERLRNEISAKWRAERTATELAAQYRIRGCDSTYVAVPYRLRLKLITWDEQQRKRATGAVEALTPLEEVASLKEFIDITGESDE